MKAAHAPAGPVLALGVALALPAALASVSWIVGQCVADRWAWAQWLFWTPAWAMAAVAALGVGASWRWLPRGSPRRTALAACATALAWSGLRFAWCDVGWASTAAGGAGTITVSHWNPQWPGEESLACGKALAPELADVTVITTPGSMLRFEARSVWLPDGFRAHDHGNFGIVSRIPVVEHRSLAAASVPGVGNIWLAWIVVRPEGGPDLRILAIDLPSSPRRARGDVAAGLAAALASAGLPAAPDLVVGDLNCTPGSVIIPVAAPGMSPAPPWRASGWLGTYWRPWPVLRIDHMLAGPRLEWVGYRTADLGCREHRAQVGVFRWLDGAPARGGT